MSSIYFEKGKAGVVNAPSRKRCYRCWWRSRHEGFSCAYALENDDTVLGAMKRLNLPDGAPCHYNEGGRPVTEVAKVRVANRK